jgi:hypothetical protein
LAPFTGLDNSVKLVVQQVHSEGSMAVGPINSIGGGAVQPSDPISQRVAANQGDVARLQQGLDKSGTAYQEKLAEKKAVDDKMADLAKRINDSGGRPNPIDLMELSRLKNKSMELKQEADALDPGRDIQNRQNQVNDHFKNMIKGM